MIGKRPLIVWILQPCTVTKVNDRIICPIGFCDVDSLKSDHPVGSRSEYDDHSLDTGHLVGPNKMRRGMSVESNV